MPGDALRGLITPDMSPAILEELRERHGLNNPWYIQYFDWMRGMIVDRDFGASIVHHTPVFDMIGFRMLNTIRLSALTTLLTYLIALPLGIIAGRKHGKFIDKSIMFYTFVALAMPTVILALIFLVLFGFGRDIQIGSFIINFGVFPVLGSVDPLAYAAGGLTSFFSRIHHLILPAITGALLSTITLIYFLRSEIIDAETSDYVTTARAKGVPEKKIYTGHIFRNACLPIAGGFAGIVTGLFGGSIFIETVFTYPGMGQLFIESLSIRDFPVLNILIMFFGIMSVITGLLSDIIITIVDPRIRIK